MSIIQEPTYISIPRSFAGKANSCRFVAVFLIWIISIQITFAQGRYSAIAKFAKGLAPWAAAGAAAGAGAVVTTELARKYDASTSPGEAIYSLMFDMNSDADALKWADIFSKPDIFAVVQVEGVGEYLIPHIINEYAGQCVIWTFKMPAIPKNRNVVVQIYDDDSTSDQIWNNILQTRWSVTVDGAVIYGVARASVSANGQVQLLNQKVTIDASDYICGFALKVPSSFMSNEWTADGNLVNSSGVMVGKIGISQKYIRPLANSAATEPKKKWYEVW